jgi:hypothetical protein
MYVRPFDMSVMSESPSDKAHIHQLRKYSSIFEHIRAYSSIFYEYSCISREYSKNMSRVVQRLDVHRTRTYQTAKAPRGCLPLHPAVGSGGRPLRPLVGHFVRIPIVGRSGRPTVGVAIHHAVHQSRSPGRVAVCRWTAGRVRQTFFRHDFPQKRPK